MKGVISFILVLLFVFPLFYIARLQLEARETNAFYENQALFLEKKYFLELGIKNVFRQVFWSAEGRDRRELAGDVARKLSSAESFLEKSFEREGVLVDLWFGVAGEEEISLLKKRILESRKPLKCANCFDFDSLSLDADGKPALQSIAFIDADVVEKKIIVSKNGFAFIPSATVTFPPAGKAFFGASIFFPEQNASSVALLPEGFSGEYG